MDVLFVWIDDYDMPQESKWTLDSIGTVPVPGDSVDLFTNGVDREPAGIVVARQLRTRPTADGLAWDTYWRVQVG